MQQSRLAPYDEPAGQRPNIYNPIPLYEMMRLFMRHRSFNPLMVLSLCFALGLALGCERKPEDLEQWRNAKGGMEKMQQWAQDAEQPRPVRIRAVEILVEEGRSNALEPTLQGVDEEDLRAEMANASTKIVENMWSAQDFPKLDDDAKKQGGVEVGESKSVDAKDAAFFLSPFATGEAKQKLEAILSEWLKEDWELRNQLGTTTVGQIAERAGEAGDAGLMAWLKESSQPSQVAEVIKRRGAAAPKEHEELLEKTARVLLERAETDHPELSASLQSAVFSFDHDALVPYLERAISDPESSNKTVGAAMDALVRVRGERAAPFFSDLLKTRSGLIRWVAATHVAEILGKPAFSYVSTALPVEMDTYPGVEDDGLKENTEYFCNMYKGEMDDMDVSSVDDQLSRGLESSRWPARLLALQCAEIFDSSELLDAVKSLENDRQQVPGWGEQTTIGAIAKGVAEALSKS